MSAVYSGLSMAIRTSAAVVCGILVLGVPPTPATRAVERPQSHALVFADRDNPHTFTLVEDFRVNDTISNPDGDRFFLLRTRQGAFELPFESVAEVQFTRFHAMDFLETATYDVNVILPLHGLRQGTIELRSLKGTAYRNPWYRLLMTRREDAARMHRILFVRRD